MPLLLLLVLFLVFARLIWSYCKPTFAFSPVASNAQVLYEPRAQKLAQQFALFLPIALNTIERKQLKAFQEPVFVYICDTTSSFSEFTMLDGAIGACMSPTRIFISPLVAERDHQMDYLTHELSHAHLRQQVGELAFRFDCPNWFKEGLATYVSNGAGAGLVSEEQAKGFIRAGSEIEVTENGLDSIDRQVHRFNVLEPWPIPAHMFYRQSMMFVAYLKHLDPMRFKQLLDTIEHGGKFRDCFVAAYGQNAKYFWKQFVLGIKQGP